MEQKGKTPTIKEISFSKGRKIGLPNYSSADVHVSMTVSLEEGENTQKVFEYLKLKVQSQIDEALSEYGLKDEIVESGNKGAKRKKYNHNEYMKEMLYDDTEGKVPF